MTVCRAASSMATFGADHDVTFLQRVCAVPYGDQANPRMLGTSDLFLCCTEHTTSSGFQAYFSKQVDVLSKSCQRGDIKGECATTTVQVAAEVIIY